MPNKSNSLLKSVVILILVSVMCICVGCDDDEESKASGWKYENDSSHAVTLYWAFVRNPPESLVSQAIIGPSGSKFIKATEQFNTIYYDYEPKAQVLANDVSVELTIFVDR